MGTFFFCTINGHIHKNKCNFAKKNDFFCLKFFVKSFFVWFVKKTFRFYVLVFKRKADDKYLVLSIKDNEEKKHFLKRLCFCRFVDDFF